MNTRNVPSALSQRIVEPLIRMALQEDDARCDLTSRAVISPQSRIRAGIVAKASGALAGAHVAAWTFHALDPALRCRLLVRDGAALSPGRTILTVEGSARSIFAAERTALNVLGHLCGVATLTREFVRRVQGTAVRILDTRKTLPGLRVLEKYAVAVGGGENHRFTLSDAMLIKTNQLQLLRRETGDERWDVREVIERARRLYPKARLQVEAATLSDARAALEARAGAILLDNMPLRTIRAAVALRRRLQTTTKPATELEVSGGVTLANVRAIAQTGIERISIGRLTHSAPSLDLSLRVLT